MNFFHICFCLIVCLYDNDRLSMRLYCRNFAHLLISDFFNLVDSFVFFECLI